MPLKAAQKPAPKNGKPMVAKATHEMPPEEQVKHIPKTVIEEEFMRGRILQSKRSLGQKAADLTTRWVGSWVFIILLFVFMAIWMSLNVYLISVANWDTYPFILLNFVLSCLAAIQAPIILMSQNRQTEMDRMKAERDFAVNRKSEKEIEEIQQGLKEIKALLKRGR